MWHPFLAEFADLHGRVSLRRLRKFVDTEPPPDHVDPALREDPLPQPFRTIDKVLSTFILDPAWDTIVVRVLTRGGGWGAVARADALAPATRV